jgi:ATP-dependent exoDNAse (exonuclease V) alpha subunit
MAREAREAREAKASKPVAVAAQEGPCAEAPGLFQQAYAGGIPEAATPAPAPAPSPLDAPEALPAEIAALAEPTFSFLTGPAGCGKTYLARQWAQADSGVLICATTGIAAVNLGDAVTVNATLKYFNTESLQEAFLAGWLQARMRKLRAAGVTRYVLDEVSMLGADALTVLVDAVEELNDEAAVDMGHEPRIGLTLVGDFLQLPPVQERYAFLSPRWDRFEAATVTLSGIRRQADPAFIEALRALRVGDADRAVPILADRLVPAADSQFEGTTILAKNLAVDRFNRMRHESLPPPVLRYEAKVSGEPLKEWEKIPAILGLKRGALVMILANQYDADVPGMLGSLVYANGDLGTLVDGDPAKQTAQVQLQRTGEIVTVVPTVKQNLEPTGAKGKKADRYRVIGEIVYLPLRLAYASTVHKSQGLTLDQVQVDVGDRFFRSPAMTYVALSRARSLQGLRLVGTASLLRDRCTVAEEVRRWA